MTAVIVLLAIIIVMLYLGLGFLVFIITFFHDCHPDLLHTEKREFIEIYLVVIVMLWPIVLLSAMFTKNKNDPWMF